MNKDRIALALVGVLGLMIMFMGIGGIFAAVQGRGMDSGTAAMLATLAGAIVAGTTAVMAGKAQDAPPVNIPPDPAPAPTAGPVADPVQPVAVPASVDPAVTDGRPVAVDDVVDPDDYVGVDDDLLAVYDEAAAGVGPNDGSA